MRFFREIFPSLPRLRCRLWGCRLDEQFPFCECCHADLYDADFVQCGYFWRLQVGWAWLKALPSGLARRCDVCGKRMWFTKEPCCSEQCFSEWIPF